MLKTPDEFDAEMEARHAQHEEQAEGMVQEEAAGHDLHHHGGILGRIEKALDHSSEDEPTGEGEG